MSHITQAHRRSTSANQEGYNTLHAWWEEGQDKNGRERYVRAVGDLQHIDLGYSCVITKL